MEYKRLRVLNLTDYQETFYVEFKKLFSASADSGQQGQRIEKFGDRD